MWKPGQLVTIEGKVYRVCHDPKTINACHKCEQKSESLDLCILTLCGKIEEKYTMHSYFKQVCPKT